MSKLKHVYEQSTNNNVHWDRIDKQTIIVWTPGYKTANAYRIEKFLLNNGLRTLNQDFDQLCGQTWTKYHHSIDEAA